jgi:hypothetical protein
MLQQELTHLPWLGKVRSQSLINAKPKVAGDGFWKKQREYLGYISAVMRLNLSCREQKQTYHVLTIR